MNNQTNNYNLKINNQNTNFMETLCLKIFSKTHQIVALKLNNTNLHTRTQNKLINQLDIASKDCKNELKIKINKIITNNKFKMKQIIQIQNEK